MVLWFHSDSIFYVVTVTYLPFHMMISTVTLLTILQEVAYLLEFFLSFCSFL